MWLTYITQFQIPAGKVYVSPMIDRFDGIVVSWSIATGPNAEVVNAMQDAAIDNSLRTVLDPWRPPLLARLAIVDRRRQVGSLHVA